MPACLILIQTAARVANVHVSWIVGSYSPIGEGGNHVGARAENLKGLPLCGYLARRALKQAISIESRGERSVSPIDSVADNWVSPDPRNVDHDLRESGVRRANEGAGERREREERGGGDVREGVARAGAARRAKFFRLDTSLGEGGKM